MAKLQKQVIPLKILGLNGKVDSKVAPAGAMTLAENVQAIRRTSDGAVELRKRNGFTEVTGGKSINGGGSISAAVTGAAYNDELVLLDGNRLYTRSDVLGKWSLRGKAQQIAADTFMIGGNDSRQISTGGDSAPINVDVAYSDGFACHVSSGDELTLDTPVFIYVRDMTTGNIVSSFTFGLEYRAKVVACSNAFFIFTWYEPTSGGGDTVRVRKIATATPATMSASQDVTTNMEEASNNGIYDVRAVPGGNKIWVAYNLKTGGVGFTSWTASTNAVDVVNDSYATHKADITIGFLNWDFSNSRGYIGAVEDAGATANVFTLEFNTTTGAVTTYTLLEAPSLSADVSITHIDGYRTSDGDFYVHWTFYDASASSPAFLVDKIRAYKSGGGGTLFDVMLSVVLASRMFKYNGKWYFQAARDFGADGQRTLLLEILENPTGANGEIAIAATLFAQDSFGAPESTAHLTSAAALTASKFLTAAPTVLNRAAVAATSRTEHFSHTAVTLDFAGVGLGIPVQFNSVLHLPGAAGREYDGKDVVESGFYVDPEAPFELDTSAASGSALTPDLTYQYCCTWARVDSRGRLHRSAPGPIATITMPDAGTIPNPQVTGFLYSLRATDTDPKFTDNDEVSPARIELWRTQGDLTVFYLTGWFENDAQSNYVGPFTDDTTDADLANNEILYTQSEELDNQKAPAVKVLRTFQNRLFALTGDGSVWFTKEGAEGFGTEWSDEFRILVDDAGGRPTALGSFDTSFVIFKRKRAYFTQGGGPDEKGAGAPFPQPQPLEMDIGVVNATGAIDVPNGILCETPEGRFILTRALAFEPVEGTEGYSVTVVGGVGVDTRSMTALVTTGAMLVRDWQLNQWFAWTGLTGVAVCRWRNQLCIFQSDGTVLKEVIDQGFDGTNTAIAEAMEFAFTRLENFRLYQLRIVGEIMGTTTLTETVTYDDNSTTAASKTRACTTADTYDLNVIPNTGRAAAVKVKLQESSTTQGFRLSEIGLEVGVKTGLKKVGTARNFS